MERGKPSNSFEIHNSNAKAQPHLHVLMKEINYHLIATKERQSSLPYSTLLPASPPPSHSLMELSSRLAIIMEHVQPSCNALLVLPASLASYDFPSHAAGFCSYYDSGFQFRGSCGCWTPGESSLNFKNFSGLDRRVP